MTDIFEKIAEERRNNSEFSICIITGTKGSVPRRTGAKMLVYPNGKIFGSIGGGRIEKKVIDDALTALKNNEVREIHYDLTKELQMSCGGSMDVYIEPVMKKNKL